MNLKIFKIFCFAPAIVVILGAILPLPITYYFFLRYFLTISALLVIYELLKKSFLIIELETALGMIAIIILYNPIFPIYLSEEAWIPLNLITAGIYFWYYNQRKDDFK